MKSIAVIGSGITGLTSAFLLKQKKCPVEIYEASSRVGGVIQSVRKDGYLAEFGPNTLLNTSKKIEHLIQMANLAGHVIFAEDVDQTRFLVRGGKVINMPSTALGFLTSPLFSWVAKFNLFMEPFRPRWKNKYEETVAHFVRRRFGQEFLTYAIDALVAGIFAGNPERLSVMHGFPKLYQGEQKYGSLSGPNSSARMTAKNGAKPLSRRPEFSLLMRACRCSQTPWQPTWTICFTSITRSKKSPAHPPAGRWGIWMAIY